MKTRTCKGNALSTGKSSCPYDRNKIVGAIVVPHGQKLPADIDGSALEELCHASRATRVCPINPFVESAKNGGEAQVAAVGYGPNQVTDVNAMTDTFTMGEFNDLLAQSLSKSMNTPYDVYYYDSNNVIYGLDDETDVLAGFPMSCIYPTITPYPTSGAKATLLVNFCHKDARTSLENSNFEQLDFNIPTFAYGLTPVKFISSGTNKYKLIEVIGGLDRTAEFGPTIASKAADVLIGTTTGVTYDEATETITISGSTAPKLKSPSDLYTAGIKGIEQA
ncbi:MAG: hypothetical protein HUK14_06045 [Muribaculaceae bacterium]|nr:hypothetical protein [Muribaculaceae bacterium]